MDSRWTQYGFKMNSIWTQSGFNVVSIWIQVAFYNDSTLIQNWIQEWIQYAATMGSICVQYEFNKHSNRGQNVFSVRLIWIQCAVNVESILITCGFNRVSMCIQYGFNVDSGLVCALSSISSLLFAFWLSMGSLVSRWIQDMHLKWIQ